MISHIPRRSVKPAVETRIESFRVEGGGILHRVTATVADGSIPALAVAAPHVPDPLASHVRIDTSVKVSPGGMVAVIEVVDRPR